VGDPIFQLGYIEDPSVAEPCSSSISLQSGQTCNIGIDFHPDEPGYFGQPLLIHDPTHDTYLSSIHLSGFGTNILLSTNSLAYGSQLVQTASVSQQLTMTNVGTTAVQVSQIYPTGANASSFIFANNCPASLPGGQSCTIHGHFTPTTSGPLSATLRIAESDGGGLRTVALSGTGVTAPVAVLSSNSLAFGSQQTGTSGGSQQVTLTNTGGSPLLIHGLSITGPNASSFVFGSDCSPSLAVNQSCTIHGHFAPQSSGALSAVITITDNAVGSPQQVALSGTGN
jgi:hypothetical protein